MRIVGIQPTHASWLEVRCAPATTPYPQIRQNGPIFSDTGSVFMPAKPVLYIKIDRLLLPITSSKVLHLSALIETYYLLDRRITLTQDEAFLKVHSTFEPERDYKVAETRLELTRHAPKARRLPLNLTPPISSYSHEPEE